MHSVENFYIDKLYTVKLNTKNGQHVYLCLVHVLKIWLEMCRW